MQRRLPIILLLSFTALIFIVTSFQPSLLDDADSTHAQAAKEMLQRNDWVTLHVNSVRYLEKAPWLYWCVAVSYKIFGVNQFAVRFPTALAIVLLALAGYAFGRWAFNEKAGWYTAAILSTCTGMFLFTRFMIPEAWLTLWFTIAHLCFLRAFFGTGEAKRWYYGFYAAMALAVLTKGLIGIVFIGGVVFWFLLLTGNWGELKHLRLFTGALLLLAIAAPWHILAGLRNDNFFWFYFVNEHFLRFIGKREPKDYNKVPFVSYWLLHLVWLFPWSTGLPLLRFPKFWQTKDRQSLITFYLIIWAAVILIFFNLSTSQEYYTFPVYAPFALLLGAAFMKAEVNAQARRYLLWANGTLAVIGIIIAGLLGSLVWQSREVTLTGDISGLLNLAEADSERYTLSLGHFFDLTTSAFAELRAPAMGAAILFGLGFLSVFLLWWKQRHHAAMTVMMVTMGLLFVCANRAQISFDPVLSSRGLANEIMEHWEPDAKIIFNGEYETGSSIAFYTNQQILLLNGKVTGMAWGSKYPDAPPVFLDEAEFLQLWNGPGRVFLFTENPKKDELPKGFQARILSERGGKTVFINQP